MDTRAVLRKAGACVLLAFSLVALSPTANSQVWEATKFFKYNIENVTVSPTAPGTWNVKVVFSVRNPSPDNPGTWDIRNALPFTSAGASLTLDIGWDPGDFTNTGSANPLLSPVTTTALGAGAAIPVQVRNLQTTGAFPCTSSVECPGVADLTNRFWVARNITPVGFTAPVAIGRVALEGKPVCNGVPGYNCPAAAPAPPTYQNIPVRSEVVSFAFTPADPASAIIRDAKGNPADPRRQIVDIAKCQKCHDGNQHGATVVPRLSLHGNNRTENLGVCVICHNPNQTDVPYRYKSADPRIAGPEVPIDFKVMVHSIHSGGFRTTPFAVVGFNSSFNDFSGVRFPAELRDCTKCHIDANGKGTFELPLKPGVLGTTVTTQSAYLASPATLTPLPTFAPGARTIDVDPSNDVKMSPTAAVCSSCHDRAEVKSHMVRTGGASFATTQQAIGTTVKERCASCHGPGKEEDVRTAHEIGSGSFNSTRSSAD